MKRYISLSVIVIMLIMITTGCANDDGNYEYTTLNEIEISGVEENYIVEQFTNLSINLTLQGNESTDNYEYLWYLYQVNVNNNPDTLSFEKDLNTEITVSPGDYDLVFQVKEENKGIFQIVKSHVSVVNSYSAGLAILSDVGGFANISFINSLDNVSKNVFETVNGYKAGRNPISLSLPGYGSNEVRQMLVIATEEGSIATDPIDFRAMFDFSTMFYFPSKPGVVQVLCRTSSPGSEFIIVDGGVYSRYITYVSDPFVKYGAKVGGDYELAPFSLFGDYYAFFYDQRHQRFLADNYGGLIPVSALPDNPLFDPTNMKMKMVWGDCIYSSTAQIRAVMEDSTGKRFFIMAEKLSGFDEYWNRYYQVVPVGKLELNQEGINSTKNFTVSSTDPNFLYYANGNKIHCVSGNTGNVISTYTLPQNVDYMEFDTDSSPTTLYVGISNGSGSSESGSVYFLEKSVDGTLSETKHFDGICGRVVDFQIK